jgi:hypothetical protein
VTLGAEMEIEVVVDGLAKSFRRLAVERRKPG